MKRVALVGYYGMRNFGDDLFVHLICELRPGLLNEDTILVVGPPLKHGPLLPRTSFAVRPRFERLWRGHGPLPSFLRLSINLVAAARSQEILMGGGTVLTSLKGARSMQFRLRRLLRTSRWGAVGVSVGPFETLGDQRLRTFVEALDPLVVRDRRSLEASPDHARYGGDLAALLGRSGLAVSTPTVRNRIIYAPKESWSFDQQRLILEPIREYCADHGAAVTILCLNCHEVNGDTKACSEAAAILGDAVGDRLTYEEIGLAATVELIGTAMVVVTGRLHGGITAFVTQTPFALLSDSPKMDDFLDDIGMPDRFRGAPGPDGALAVGSLLGDADLTAVPAGTYIEQANLTYLFIDPLD